MDISRPLKSIGNTKKTSGWLGIGQIELLRATLTGSTPIQTPDIPYGWQWAFFHEAKPHNQLGRDGHEMLGNFIPDLPIKQRMWAGGSIEFYAPPKLDKPVTRLTSIKNIEAKSGSAGDLIFVTLEHLIIQEDYEILTETQNLVYKDEHKKSVSVQKAGDQKTAQASLTIKPSSILMFRYSALTFNSHRIHYDADYARDVEGYKNIVFHGPLTATLLMNFAATYANKPIKRFSFRGTAPIDTMDPFTLNLNTVENGVELYAQKHDQTIAMKAAVNFD